MANYDQRDVQDYRFGQLSSGITALDTTLASTAFAGLPATPTTTRYIPLTIADDSLGLYETVWVTGHSAASQSVTVVRGREGSSSRAWAAGSTWRIAPTIRDVVLWVANRAALPTDGHLGMRVGLADVGQIVEKTASGWMQAGVQPFGHLGRTAGFQAVGTGAYVVFDTAQELIGGMTFDNANDCLTIPVAGLYRITGHCYFTGSLTYTATGDVTINQTANPPAFTSGARMGTWKQDANDVVAHGSTVRRLAVGDKLRLWTGGNASTSTFGTDGYNGSWLEAEYVGP